MTLEQKIKALLEAANSDDKDTDKKDDQDKGGDDADNKEGGDDQGTIGGNQPNDVVDDGSDENDGDNNGDEGDDTDAKKTLQKEDYNADQYNQEHEQPGRKNVDDPRTAEKLTPDMGVKVDSQDDNGDNAKLLAGKKNVDGTGPGGQPVDGVAVDGSAIVTNPQGGVKEHMDAMFSGETLSEEFKQKASVIFEAAVSALVEERLEEQIEQINEELQAKLDEAVEVVKSDLTEQVDGFLNYVVEQWIEDNKIALESGIRVEMVNGFINGMKTLFKEHYIEVPEEKMDVVVEQAKKIDELTQVALTLDEAHDQVVSELEEVKKQRIVESVGAALTEIQKTKFVGLCESLEYTSDESFKQKVETIKESYFPVGKKETVKDDVSAVAEKVGNIGAYVNALSKKNAF